MKKCMIMFVLLIATLIIAVWSNKDRTMDAKHNVLTKSDTSTKQLLVQDITLKNRTRE